MSDVVAEQVLLEDLLQPVELEFVDVALDELPPDEALISPPPSVGLVNSVRTLGVLEPVGLKRDHGEGYVVLYGRRRIKAARAAGLEIIPAVVSDAHVAAAALAENEHRSSNDLLAFSMVSEMVSQGHTLEEIGAAVGMNASRIHSLMAMEALSPKLRQAALRGQIAATTAKRAARLNHDDQVELERILDERGRVSAGDVDELRQVAAADRFAQVATLFGDDMPERVDVLAKAAFERFCTELTALGPVSDDVARAIRSIRATLDW